MPLPASQLGNPAIVGEQPIGLALFRAEALRLGLNLDAAAEDLREQIHDLLNGSLFTRPDVHDLAFRFAAKRERQHSGRRVHFGGGSDIKLYVTLAYPVGYRLIRICIFDSRRSRCRARPPVDAQVPVALGDSPVGGNAA